MKLLTLLFSVILLSAPPADGRDKTWSKFKAPVKGSAESIGTYTRGCLLGGEALPEKAPGFTTIRRFRNRFFGHPVLVDFVNRFGKRVEAAKMESVLVGDLSQARGGPMASGHRSHQMGLDADMWFTVPRKFKGAKDEGFPSMVNEKAEVISKAWTSRQSRLIEWAAKDPIVERIFVHWVIKRQLCKTAKGNRDWLRKVRPWWGHHRHFHVRIGCPPGSRDCISQPPPPAGDGCGREVWFSKAAVARRQARAKGKPKVKKPRKPLPPRCLKLLKKQASTRR